MQSYGGRSHSVAVTIPRPPDVEELDNWFAHRHSSRFNANEWFAEAGESLDVRPLEGQPWWWLVAVRKGDKDLSQDALPWDRLIEKFSYEMSNADKRALLRALERTGDDLGVRDPKVQTVSIDESEKVYFRAVPQGRCDSRTRPPRASFLPRVLPPVAHGECVLELCELEAGAEYGLMLFNVSDALELPEVAPKPLAEAHIKTAHPPGGVHVLDKTLQVICILAMVAAVAWQFREVCAGVKQPTNYSQIELVGNEEGAGGFHQVKVRNLFRHILKGMLVSMTMFLPILGPLGLVLASDIVVGSRLHRVKISREEYLQAKEYKMGKLWQLVKDIWNVLVNVVIIPFNMYTVQRLWATYCHAWYAYVGVDIFQDSSYGELNTYGNQWGEVSGLEIGGWVPGIVLSTFLLALELESDSATTMLRRHRKRAEAHLNALAKGKELLTKLCRMDSRLFERTEEVPDLLGRRVRRLCLATIFGLLPHLWMCLRHGVPLFNSSMMWVTIVYVVNIAGVSTRFLALCDRIYHLYKDSCAELATFQALSWQEDMSTAVYDPFATRNDAVVEARKRLKENVPRIGCLKLEEPEDSKVWWHLRELVFIQIKDGRILMEMMVLISITFAFLLGVSSLFVMISLKEITAITIVTAIVMVVLLGFTYRALSFARDINSMSLEHTYLLHNIVAEMNMPLRPQMPLDSHLQQERFLLQVATLVEKQPPPETVASFAVSPQLVSLVAGVLGLLTFVSLYNLLNGIIWLGS
mmetsp:Transcript_55923/g.163432  ORF Transcript_55923/g.163432 Transcript_55923/m.163432 type:complete len:752 (+) Transcript_55923:1-2256(+)